MKWHGQKKDKYLKKDDPLFPCNQPFILDLAKGNCFSYLTPHLWEVAGGDVNNPTEKDFAASFPYCARLTGADTIQKPGIFVGVQNKSKGGDLASIKTMYNFCNQDVMNESQKKICFDYLAHAVATKPAFKSAAKSYCSSAKETVFCKRIMPN